MMHNTAINFTVSVDDTGKNLVDLINELEQKFKVRYESGLELITIRYYNQETIDRVLVDKEVISELKDTYTCQLLVKKI
jgi:aspartate kinase